MSTTTDLTTLKINYLTQEQYEEALRQGQINPNELYFTPDSLGGSVQDVTVDSVSVVDSNGVAVINLTGKQDTLVSGASIKTINNTSLLSSGNIDVQTPLTFDTEPTTSSSNPVTSSGIKTYIDNSLPVLATETIAGTIKLNPSESITLNPDGQLDVGGRLGQSPSSTGVYSPKTISPASVGKGSLLLTEASGTSLGSKSLGVVTGMGLTLKTAAAAGATQYVVANTYLNRIFCASAVGATVTKDEASAEETYVTVTSVQINGSSFVPDSSADSSVNNIIITTDKSINPSSSISQIRLYLKGAGFSNLFVGQAVGGAGGASILVGQRVYAASGNACAMIGADMYNTGNGNAMFGRNHISRKNRSFLAGTGHDTSNARTESVAALGQWSDIDANTLFAVGNGTSATVRSNAFEVLNDGIVLKSPNGTRYKITVSDTGEVTTTAL